MYTIILSSHSYLLNGNWKGFTPQQWISFITELKQRAVEYSNSSLPIIYGLDSVHGANYVYGAVIFPHV